MACLIHKHFGDGDRHAFGVEYAGNAVTVKIDQVPAVCSLSDQVAVYTFWFLHLLANSWSWFKAPMIAPNAAGPRKLF